MNEQKSREILAGHLFEKAADAFEVGKMALENGKLISAVNRLYYAAFYAISSILMLKGQAYAKHSAVRAALHRDLIKTGAFPTEFGELFDRLFKDRQDGDYAPETKFNADEIGLLLEQTRRFVDFAKTQLPH